MLDFSPVRTQGQTWMDFAADLSKADLYDLTNEMADTMLQLIADCADADVVFVPVDPDAHDAYAENQAEEDLAWTLGHVLVHATASSEEGAFLAAELARGVEHHGRSRYEVHWETVKTIAECRRRLEESHRMILASLDSWPDDPHLDNAHELREGLVVNPIVRFIFGLSHAESHLEQIAEIVRQSKAARE